MFTYSTNLAYFVFPFFLCFPLTFEKYTRTRKLHSNFLGVNDREIRNMTNNKIVFD